MEKVSLREYAKRHKLSYFNVMKMVKNGDVKSETLTEDGKDIAYILIEDKIEKEIKEKIIQTDAKQLTLQEENSLLKKEVERLRMALEKCNKRTVLAL